MKFRCTTDQWRQFRGHVFEYGRPTEVADRGSIEALLMHPDFERVEDEPINGVSRETLSLPKRRGRPAKSEAVL
jgi:hypothetical protein